MIEEVPREKERHLDRHDLPGVMAAHDENLGLVLVDRGVVRYLDRTDRPALDRHAQGIDARAGRIGEGQSVELRLHLRVRMILPEIRVERRGSREIGSFENGGERALRFDPGELLLGHGEIRPPVPVDVENIDAPLDERLLRDLLRELRADDRRRGRGLRKSLAGQDRGEGLRPRAMQMTFLFTDASSRLTARIEPAPLRSYLSL